MEAIQKKEFYKLWSDLRRTAMMHGVSLDDASDIAQEVIIKAQEAFDPARGAFQPFCFHILKNRMRNFYRDKKPQQPLLDGIDIADPAARADIIMLMERELLMKEAIAMIVMDLDPEEIRFLEELGRVVEETERTTVTLAAKRLGYSDQQGWNIFRRIQRKAEHHRGIIGEIGLEEEPTARVPARTVQDISENREEMAEMVPRMLHPNMMTGRPTLLAFAQAYSSAVAFRRFFAGLTHGQRERMERIL